MQASVDDLFTTALTRSSDVVRVLSPMGTLYWMGVLVQLKGTQYYRLALLPMIVWLSWRGAFVDLSGGDPAKIPFNGVLAVYMCFTAMRGISWATVQEPYRRLNNGESGVRAALGNAWDLIFTTRGIGWNWSQGPVPPKPTFQTESRIAFVLFTAAQFAFHVLCFDVCMQTVRVLFPDTIDGGSLFDHTLPPLLELSRAVFVALVMICMVYCGLQWTYELLAIIGVVLFQQTPSQWPPLFDAPWLSTSLSEFWGRRWHQILRQSVVTFGGPFHRAFGRMGGLLGAFFVSGVIHDVELRTLGKGASAFVVVGPWLMTGVGVVLERVWKKVTGRRVCEVCGWVWTFGWLGLCSMPMVDAWVKAGLFGVRLFPGGEPSLALVAFVRRCLGGSS